MDHAGFIFSAYAAATVIAGGLVAWIMLDGWRLRRSLADLESRGARRRSAGGT